MHLNTLDYELWDEVTEQEEWDNIYNAGFKGLKRLRPKGSKDFREFQFDVLMANPPFAGDIKEPRMIARYDLAKKPDGKWQTKVGRDILFIERNLNFLKPGGRMAIVLPQGRFNNSSDKNIRDFIAERCRILAVVGLHGNTFKPHTGTKTSVLFVQKWNDDPKVGALCPRQDDYNIFFATMRKSGKDNSGEKMWRKISSFTSPPDELSELMPPSPMQRVVGVEGDFLQDVHGHLVVDHDLYNHEGLTEDGIAEAFIEFAKKENLSFFEPSPSVTPFDAVRYRRLMDGLEAVESCFSQLERTTRIDSEFFKKYHIKLANLLGNKETEALTKFVYVSDGNHLKISDSFSDEGIPYYRGQDIHTFFIERSNPIFIDEEAYNQSFMIRSHLRMGDILLSIIGTIGAVSLVSTNQPATCNCKLAILRPKNQKSEFIATFLNSEFGQSQIDRFTRCAVQMGLLLEDMDQIIVPVLNENFKKLITDIINYSKLLLDQADLTYQQAEDLLLSELGLKDWQPTEETVAVKSFSESFLSSNRLDAEYYQPKQQKVMTIMHQSGLCIGDVVSLAKRKFQPEKQGTFNYIEIGNLSGEGFANSEVVAMEEAPSRAQWFVKPNDVITSTVRPIRRLSALIESEQNNYICSSGFAVLKPTKIEPEVLLLYLRSPILCEILDLHTTASMYPAISTEGLLKIPITLPKESTRQKITEKVRESRKAREQSKQLLEIAKTGVERAIETDEATATTWINQQLEALGINLSNSN
ncbi:MAG: N-6 DNA methylase [Nostoc sp.]|uniref:N-6 DNA methylase n=1 Tax=Nostoc sp. TaxID=1180 RepID=UPI002FF72AB4